LLETGPVLQHVSGQQAAGGGQFVLLVTTCGRHSVELSGSLEAVWPAPESWLGTQSGADGGASAILPLAVPGRGVMVPDVFASPGGSVYPGPGLVWAQTSPTLEPLGFMHLLLAASHLLIGLRWALWVLVPGCVARSEDWLERWCGGQPPPGVEWADAACDTPGAAAGAEGDADAVPAEGAAAAAAGGTPERQTGSESDAASSQRRPASPAGMPVPGSGAGGRSPARIAPEGAGSGGPARGGPQVEDAYRSELLPSVGGPDATRVSMVLQRSAGLEALVLVACLLQALEGVVAAATHARARVSGPVDPELALLGALAPGLARASLFSGMAALGCRRWVSPVCANLPLFITVLSASVLHASLAVAWEQCVRDTVPVLAPPSDFVRPACELLTVLEYLLRSGLIAGGFIATHFVATHFRDMLGHGRLRGPPAMAVGLMSGIQAMRRLRALFGALFVIPACLLIVQSLVLSWRSTVLSLVVYKALDVAVWAAALGALRPDAGVLGSGLSDAAAAAMPCCPCYGRAGEFAASHGGTRSWRLASGGGVLGLIDALNRAAADRRK